MGQLQAHSLTREGSCYVDQSLVSAAMATRLAAGYTGLQINIYWLLLYLIYLLAPMCLSAEYHVYPIERQPASDRHYQWRPLNQQQEAAATSNREFQSSEAGSNQPYRDYTDTPFGLTRGSYRPAPQRHQITPYHQGYRFRPLSPSEQERIKQRNLVSQDSHQSFGELRFRPLNNPSETGRFGYSSSKPYQFRPDPRLNPGFSSDRNPFYTSEPTIEVFR
jgi:hypothetical protein